MPVSVWQRRIQRAEELARKHPSASEILRFFIPITRFHEAVYERLERASVKDANLSFQQPVEPAFLEWFSEFVASIGESAPQRLADALQQFARQGDDSNYNLLNEFWRNVGNGVQRSAEEGFVARAFLQPYAELVRSRTEHGNPKHTPCLCPHCDRKPGIGILRPLGDGGQRFLACSFCLGEWEFRRLVCAACGEEDHAKLPIYQAEGYPEVRVECCDTCKTYLKTVDLTKNGLAEPVVDEIASIPLDLWAQERGYTKLQPNLLQL